jgi:uncharacterized membrane protein YgaE (UPF0421/DUF939 family)
LAGVDMEREKWEGQSAAQLEKINQLESLLAARDEEKLKLEKENKDLVA